MGKVGRTQRPGDLSGPKSYPQWKISALGQQGPPLSSVSSEPLLETATTINVLISSGLYSSKWGKNSQDYGEAGGLRAGKWIFKPALNRQVKSSSNNLYCMHLLLRNDGLIMGEIKTIYICLEMNVYSLYQAVVNSSVKGTKLLKKFPFLKAKFLKNPLRNYVLFI